MTTITLTYKAGDHEISSRLLEKVNTRYGKQLTETKAILAIIDDNIRFETYQFENNHFDTV